MNISSIKNKCSFNDTKITYNDIVKNTKINCEILLKIHNSQKIINKETTLNNFYNFSKNSINKNLKNSKTSISSTKNLFSKLYNRFESKSRLYAGGENNYYRKMNLETDKNLKKKFQLQRVPSITCLSDFNYKKFLNSSSSKKDLSLNQTNSQDQSFHGNENKDVTSCETSNGAENFVKSSNLRSQYLSPNQLASNTHNSDVYYFPRSSYTFGLNSSKPLHNLEPDFLKPHIFNINFLKQQQCYFQQQSQHESQIDKSKSQIKLNKVVSQSFSSSSSEIDEEIFAITEKVQENILNDTSNDTDSNNNDSSIENVSESNVNSSKESQRYHGGTERKLYKSKSDSNFLNSLKEKAFRMKFSTCEKHFLNALHTLQDSLKSLKNSVDSPDISDSDSLIDLASAIKERYSSKSIVDETNSSLENESNSKVTFGESNLKEESKDFHKFYGEKEDPNLLDNCDNKSLSKQIKIIFPPRRGSDFALANENSIWQFCHPFKKKTHENRQKAAGCSERSVNKKSLKSDYTRKIKPASLNKKIKHLPHKLENKNKVAQKDVKTTELCNFSKKKGLKTVKPNVKFGIPKLRTKVKKCISGSNHKFATTNHDKKRVTVLKSKSVTSKTNCRNQRYRPKISISEGNTVRRANSLVEYQNLLKTLFEKEIIFNANKNNNLQGSVAVNATKKSKGVFIYMNLFMIIRDIVNSLISHRIRREKVVCLITPIFRYFVKKIQNDEFLNYLHKNKMTNVEILIINGIVKNTFKNFYENNQIMNSFNSLNANGGNRQNSSCSNDVEINETEYKCLLNIARMLHFNYFEKNLLS